MKKCKYIILSLIICLCLCGCEKETGKIPDLAQIKSICNLATLEAYYHNVAKYTKEAESGITHLFEKDREMWIEYTGKAKIGIDMSDVTMEIKENKVKIYIPNAKLLSIDIGKIDKDSYITNDDSWLNKNEFTPEEETKAINKAQEKMKEQVESNSQLLLQAQTRAKDLIEEYIIQLGKLSNIEYEIEWIYDSDEK